MPMINRSKTNIGRVWVGLVTRSVGHAIGGKVLVEKGNKTIKETHDLWERIRQKRKQSDGKVAINENKRIRLGSWVTELCRKGGLR